MDNQDLYNEKRDIARMDVETAVTYKIVGQTKQYTGVSRNLSSKGVAFVTEHELTPGMLLELSIIPTQSKTGEEAPLETTVEVLRVEPQEGGTGFDVAGGIKEIMA